MKAVRIRALHDEHVHALGQLALGEQMRVDGLDIRRVQNAFFVLDKHR